MLPIQVLFRWNQHAPKAQKPRECREEQGILRASFTALVSKTLPLGSAKGLDRTRPDGSATGSHRREQRKQQ